MSSAPQAGSILAGKYQVERVLGVGGMGVVVAAHHLQLDQKVAIKYLLPDALQNTEVVERFAREARAAAKIRGEHVARVIDVGKFDDGAPYMVMEYLEGHDLAKQLEEYGPLRVEDAIRYLLETCEALAEAHAAKIIHRDLKPANLFLAKQPDKRSIVKVLDFGISKAEGSAPSAALTKTSAFMGTAYYMSPEQMMSARLVDARSDIWALGVILYELLSGRPPFRGETVPEVVAAILNNQPEPLGQLRPDLPPGLESVVMKCLQTKQEQRPSSVAVLAAALAPFAFLADRVSVETTRRVLSEAPSADALPTIVTPMPAMAPTGVPGAALAATPAGGLTQQGLAASVAGVPNKSGRAVIAVGLVVAVGVGVGAFALAQRRAPVAAPDPGAGIVSAPVSAANGGAAAGGIAVLPGSGNGTVAPLPLPGAPAPTVAPDEPHARATTGANPRVKTVEKPSEVVGDKAARSKITPPVASVAGGAPAAPPIASVAPPPASVAPAPPPTPGTTKNPMQMGIK